MRHRRTLAVAWGTALLLAGCGGGEEAAPEPREARIPRAVAADLAAKSEAVAEKLEAGDVCGAAYDADALEDAAESAIREGRIPARYRQELLSEARALQNEVNCPEAPPPAPPAPEETEEDSPGGGEEKGKGEDSGKGKGKGEEKGKGKGEGDGGGGVEVPGVTVTLEEGEG